MHILHFDLKLTGDWCAPQLCAQYPSLELKVQLFPPCRRSNPRALHLSWWWVASNCMVDGDQGCYRCSDDARDVAVINARDA